VYEDICVVCEFMLWTAITSHTRIQSQYRSTIATGTPTLTATTGGTGTTGTGAGGGTRIGITDGTGTHGTAGVVGTGVTHISKYHSVFYVKKFCVPQLSNIYNIFLVCLFNFLSITPVGQFLFILSLYLVFHIELKVIRVIFLAR
jgi:hypothetical protein